VSYAYRLLRVRRALFRMSLAMDVCRVLCSMRLTMDYVEGFVLCL